MLNVKKILSMFLIACAFTVIVKSQAPTSDFREQRQYLEEQRKQNELNRQRNEQELNKRQQNSDRLTQNSLRNRLKSPARTHSTQSQPLTKEEKARIRKILTPNAEDLIKYKDFLQMSNTGIFRLFPDFDCESEGVIRVDGNCANLVPGSWNYSFRQKDYSDSDFLDVRLKDGNLIGEGFLSQEILVRLGDVPLENVSPASGGIKFLMGFTPETESEKVKRQFAQIANGIETDGYKYAKRVKAEENTTYAMRIVAYRNEDKTINRLSGKNATADDFKFINSNHIDKRIDLTVAFRIVRRDENGGITILWKEINRRDTPKIVFAKNEKPSDIKPGK